MGNMVIATSKIWISTEECFSLKEKRQIITSIKNRLRNKFNLAVAEIDLLNNYQESVIGIACISNDSNHANSMISKAVEFIETSFPGRLNDYQVDIDFK